MNRFFKILIFLLIIIIPVFFIFKNIFTINRPLVGGDAPFFYSEGLKELITEPLSWTSRGNNFGGQNMIIWITPLTFIYGLLGSLFKLGNGLSVRITFYVPSIIFSMLGGYLFAKYLKFSQIASFFTALFYVLNTYFIILIDGGQVGVALAYSIFPFTLILLKKLFDKPSVNYFFAAICVLFINGIADPRIALVSVITLFIWAFVESLVNNDVRSLKKLVLFIPLPILWFFTNLFWIYPLIKGSGIEIGVQSFNFTSLLSSMFVFQPHFPANQFGKINPPPFYFVVLPILIFANLFINENKKNLNILLIVMLIFMFVSKGNTPPIGAWYDFLISKIPFGSSFRDSSKFFTPLVLFAGALIGNSINSLTIKISNKNIGKFILGLAFISLVVLVHPAILGKMNFVLSNKDFNSDSEKIYQNIKNQNEFFRSVYFSEHPSNAFESLQHPIVDGKNLVNLLPFKTMNNSEEVFNFVNNSNFVNWFRLLGIKYIYLSGNPRDLFPAKGDIKDWENTKSVVSKTNGLTKLDWGTSFPVYEINNPGPRNFIADKLIGVIGPESENNEKQLVPSVYFEDEKFDPSLLVGKNPNSVKLFFNHKDQLDLTMSFLKQFFVPTLHATTNQWASYDQSEYLKAKYELLIRGVKYSDFDYGKGIAFSTVPGEKIEIPLTATSSGEYILSVRSMSATNSGNLKVSFNNTNFDIVSKQNLFGWHTFGPFKLDKGIYKINLQNSNGLQIVNTVGLIPKQNFEEAEKLSDNFIKYFGEINENQISYENLGSLKFDPEATLKDKIIIPQKGYWIITTDSYSKFWNIQKGTEYFEPVPVYGIINGFYFEPGWADVHIEYKGQDFVRWGIYGSICSILLVFLTYFWLISKDGKD